MLVARVLQRLILVRAREDSNSIEEPNQKTRIGETSKNKKRNNGDGGKRKRSMKRTIKIDEERERERRSRDRRKVG